MMKSFTLFCGFKNLALKTINVLACMLLVAGAFAFTGSPTDNCSDAEFTTIYMGEHNGSKYYCSSTNGWTWQQAKTYCENNGGHLAIVNNAQENEYLRARIMSDFAWIGYSDHAHEGSYKWVDGSVGNYTNWNAGEPNNSGGDEDFTRLLKSNGKWTDRNASFKAEFVMEIPNEGTDLCPNKSFTVKNDGDCPVRLYHWVATGDIYLTTIQAGSSYNLDAAAGSMYRVINTNQDWNNLLYDEHITVSADCEQTWTLNPDYCTPVACNGEITAIKLNELDDPNLIDLFDGAVVSKCTLSGGLRLRAEVAGDHESLEFIVSGPANFSNTENQVTYDSYEFQTALGTYTVTTKLYSEPNLGGTLCDESTITFTIEACDPCNNLGGDNDNDGVCAEEDCDDNDATVPANEGTACDDNDATTEDDKILADGCTCEGTPIVVVVDNDNDGVPADEDCDDNDAAVPTTVGAACDDNDATTEDDKILADGCTCEGTDIVVEIPEVKIDDVTVNEEDGTATLTVSIDAPVDYPVVITYTTADDSATADDDYAPSTNTVTIPAGSTSVTITLPIVDDATPEATEIFEVVLTSAPNATIADNIGTVTILDTDEDVVSTCDAAYTVEGNSITITGLNDDMNMVQILDADWNVLYECNSWTVACEETTVFDNLDEGSYMVSIQTTDAAWNQVCNIVESFTIAGAVEPCANTVTESGVIGGAQTGCDSFDPTPLTSISPASGGSGTIEYLWLASTNGCPGSVSQAIDGATGETYDPGVLTETTWFRRCSRRQPCEAWYGVGESNCIKITVNESGTPGATCNDNNPNTSNDVIQADGCTCKGESTPGETANIVIGDVVVNEEDGTATVTVTIDQVLGEDLTIDYTAGDDTADATDYIPGNGTLTIPAGELTGTITFPILDDSTPESTEDFNITLTNPSAGTIVDGIGVVTILDTDDDGPIGTDCAAGYSVDGNAITITGLNNEMNMVQILDEDWIVLYECNSWTTACESTTVFDNLPAGSYMVSIQTTDAAWNQICNITESFTIGGGNGPVDADGDGVIAADDCDDNDASVPDFPGTPCDDGDAATSNDVLLADGCTCEGEGVVEPSDCAVTYVAEDDMITVSNLTDPVVAVKVLDENFNVAYECNAWATACNETEVIDMLDPGKYFLQVQTYDASWTAICEIFEEFTIEGGVVTPDDLDGDGVPAADDCDDNDASVPAAVGSACNDGDASTENDVILADGCSCAGTPIVVLTCDVEVTTDGLEIVVTGLTAPIVSTKVIDTDWNYVYECGTTMTTACNETEVIGGLPDGTYFVSVQTYDAAWNEICNEWIEVVVAGVDPVLPVLSIDDVTVNEEDGTASLTISIDQPSDSPITVVYSTNNGTAVDGEDYTTVTDAIAIIPAGSTSVTVEFPIVDNDTPEATEVYIVDLTSPQGATIADAQGTITILDTDEEVELGTCDNVDAIRAALDLGSSCHGDDDAGRAIWIEGELFTVVGDMYFVEYADGTAQLKGSIRSLTNGAIKEVDVYFTGKTNNGNAYTNSCSTLNHVDDWYYYADFTGTIGGELVIPHPDHGFQIGLGANVKNNSFGASGWFTLGTADGTRGDFNFNLGSLIECSDNNDNGVIDVCEADNAGVCIERTVTDVDHCANDYSYGFYFRSAENNQLYSWEYANLVEYTDGTATLTGRVVNQEDANIGFDVDIYFTGRTNNPNAEGVKEHRCDATVDYNSFYYYSDFTGTLNGLNNIAGLAFDIASFGNSFQLGVGASATGQANEFGASAWWSAVQTSAANNGTVFTPTATAYGPTGGGDININLSGTYPTCLGNVNPLVAVDSDTAESTKVITRENTTEEMNEVAKVANFSIFPNPATEYVNIEVSEFAGQDVQVLVFNAIGVQTYNNNISNLNDNVISIDLAQFGNGVYTVMFAADGNVTAKQFVVSKQ